LPPSTGGRTCQKMISSAKSLTLDRGLENTPEASCLWIRTAGGPQMGFGHLRRSLLLAHALRDCGVALFIIDEEDASSCEYLVSQGCLCVSNDPIRLWTQVPKPLTILIDTRCPEGLHSLISGANARKIPVVSIHDLGLNPLPSDILIDGSIAPDSIRNCGKGSFYCGTQYMILDPAYRSLHQQRKKIRSKIRSVFVNLGGGVSERYFAKILQGLQIWNRDLEVVGARGFTDWGQQQLESRDWHPLHFRWEAESLSPFLFEADLAITAGGLSAYEALCCGTPLAALSYDTFQQITISGLATAGACFSLGSGDDLTPGGLRDAISAMDSDYQGRVRSSSRGKRTVDGLGLRRVSEIVRNAVHRGQEIEGTCDSGHRV
jgi:spore coat polysaccharide biosynthesis predicted glycosyltransferase SpsG